MHTQLQQEQLLQGGCGFDTNREREMHGRARPKGTRSCKGALPLAASRTKRPSRHGPEPTSHPRSPRCAVGLEDAGIPAGWRQPMSPTCFLGPAEAIVHCKPRQAPRSSHGALSCRAGATTCPSPAKRHKLPLRRAARGAGRRHSRDRDSSDGLGRWLEAVLAAARALPGTSRGTAASPSGTDTSTQMCHRIGSISHPPLSVALGPGQGKSLVKTLLLLMLFKYNRQSDTQRRRRILLPASTCFQSRGPRQHPRVAVPVAVPAWERGSSHHRFLLH